MAKGPKLPEIKKDKWIDKEYTDKNLLSTVPLRITSSLPSHRLASPESLAKPAKPALPSNSNSKKSIETPSQRFKRLKTKLK